MRLKKLELNLWEMQLTDFLLEFKRIDRIQML